MIPTFDMAVNEVFFEKYPDAQLQHQIQVQGGFVIQYFTDNQIIINAVYYFLVWKSFWPFSQSRSLLLLCFNASWRIFFKTLAAFHHRMQETVASGVETNTV